MKIPTEMTVSIRSTIRQMLLDLPDVMGDINQYLGYTPQVLVSEDWSDVDISVHFSRYADGNSQDVFVRISHATRPNISLNYFPSIKLRLKLDPKKPNRVGFYLDSVVGSEKEICYLSDIIVNKWPQLKKE